MLLNINTTKHQSIRVSDDSTGADDNKKAPHHVQRFVYFFQGSVFFKVRGHIHYPPKDGNAECDV